MFVIGAVSLILFCVRLGTYDEHHHECVNYFAASAAAVALHWKCTWLYLYITHKYIFMWRCTWWRPCTGPLLFNDVFGRFAELAAMGRPWRQTSECFYRHWHSMVRIFHTKHKSDFFLLRASDNNDVALSRNGTGSIGCCRRRRQRHRRFVDETLNM